MTSDGWASVQALVDTNRAYAELDPVLDQDRCPQCGTYVQVRPDGARGCTFCGWSDRAYN
jgi:hypothetical protein